MKDYADLQIEGINMNDYPDFVDAFIASGSVKDGNEWRELTDAELDELNNDSELVYSLVEREIY